MWQQLEYESMVRPDPTTVGQYGLRGQAGLRKRVERQWEVRMGTRLIHEKKVEKKLEKETKSRNLVGPSQKDRSYGRHWGSRQRIFRWKGVGTGNYPPPALEKSSLCVRRGQAYRFNLSCHPPPLPSSPSPSFN